MRYGQVRDYAPGSRVVVGPAYQGSGRYAQDGTEGVYIVLKPLPPGDFYLARPGEDEWQVICHYTRLRPAQPSRSPAQPPSPAA